MTDLEKVSRKLKQVMGKLPLQNTRIENIVKVVFEGADGKRFTVDNARVWKIDLAGNLAYQVQGDIPDLVEYFATPEPVVEGEKQS